MKYQILNNQYTYPSYPSQRLASLPNDLENYLAKHKQPPTLPSGPWEINNTPLPSEKEIETFQKLGLKVDELGRPFHPQIRSILANINSGIVTGKGKYFHWGPNYTVDPIIVYIDAEARPSVKTEIALIRRKDIGTWALPGGFIDPNESALTAATREAQEEMGDEIYQAIADIKPIKIYQGPVNDARTTAHAWADTTALLYFVFEKPKIHFNKDECIDGKWFKANELPKNLHGSHNHLIYSALHRYL